MKINFAIPGDLSLPTGGYAYARRVLAEWSEIGVSADVAALPGSFPHPSAADLQTTLAQLRSVEGGLLIDGLAYGAFSEEIAAEIGPRSVVLVHHPLCDETGLPEAEAARLRKSEALALSHARAVICTSPATARDLKARFGIPDAAVAIPGTDPAPRAPLVGSPPDILAVGTVSPRKGYDVLVEALDACRDLDWHCEIVGASDRDPMETAKLTTLITDLHLQDRIVLRGAKEDMSAAYLGADLFVAPSRHEGYGMAIVEAMAHGLPVIATTAGALPDTAPCATLVPPEDADALAAAIQSLVRDRSSRLELGARCRRFAKNLPDWTETARLVADLVRRAE